MGVWGTYLLVSVLSLAATRVSAAQVGNPASQLTLLQQKLADLEATAQNLTQKIVQLRKEFLLIANQTDPNKEVENGTIPSYPDAPLWYRSCKEVPSNKSDKYLIRPTEKSEPFLAYCDQLSFGGGWLVFQLRYNGSVDFRRNWTEYRNGFGSVDGEFWLGLERLHRLTSAKPHELLVVMEDFTGNYEFALYSEFEIDNEMQHYSLKKLGTFIGSAGDSMRIHKGMKFSTSDRDNDRVSSLNCASSYEGAWWYDSCYQANLNGVYMNERNAKAIVWYTYKNATVGMAYSKMMIREA
uniref:Fibrinogen C-terminal domain-containing protein n=1 Tax=Anopheles epiroticus TaxID=199890 RepID=A0A182PK84_9DIPT